MAQTHYYPTWDHSRIGTGAVTFTDNVGSWTYTASSGSFCHIDISAIVSTATELLASLQAAATTAGRTYTISFNTATGKYSFDNGANVLALTFTGAAGTIMRHILGFSANVGSTTATITSDRRPYYLIKATSEGPSAYSFPYKSSDKIAVREADDGTTYSIGPRTLGRRLDWEQRFETLAAPATNISGGVMVGGAGVFSDNASTEVPWTWEHFFDHVAATEHFAFVDDGSGVGVVCKMRKETAAHHPAMVWSDYSGYWNIKFNTYYFGSIS